MASRLNYDSKRRIFSHFAELDNLSPTDNSGPFFWAIQQENSAVKAQ